MGRGFMGPQGAGMGQENFFPSCKAGQEWDKTKPCEAGMKTPSFSPAPPHPTLLPSLIENTIDYLSHTSPTLTSVFS